LSTRDTVAFETPARSATSLIRYAMLVVHQGPRTVVSVLGAEEFLGVTVEIVLDNGFEQSVKSTSCNRFQKPVTAAHPITAHRPNATRKISRVPAPMETGNGEVPGVASITSGN
jgi:hypothetical protein